MNIKRIKVLGLLGLPLLAIAVAVMVFAFGNSTADTTEAAAGGPGMILRVDASETQACNVPAAGKVCVGLNNKFSVIIATDGIPASGYGLAQGFIDYGANGLVQKANGGPPGSSCATRNPCSLWPDVEDATFLVGAAGTTMQAGGLTGLLTQPKSNYEGDLYSFSMTCTGVNSSSTLILEPSSQGNTSGALYVDNGGLQVIPKVSNLVLNCEIPPTSTSTPTATNTPTSTPTNTPPPIPRMSKSPALQNVFLTRQGAKINPLDCFAGKGTVANVGELAEGLNQSVVSPDPKEPTSFQQLAAFEFEVHYDNKKVCVDINVGASFAAAGAVCIVEDDQPSSKPQLEGVARIGCVTIAKGHNIDSTATLASVDVYPQPDLYSEMKPNQDNGNVVHIANVNCDAGDEQGHAIPLFSCDDADITFRYLEGDVEPDCVIDAVDAQAIAFRWGVEKGSLIYKDFMNLEPSSQQQDNDIDINDLQFVFGRFGSTCGAPHPPQDPVNPKA